MSIDACLHIGPIVFAKAKIRKIEQFYAACSKKECMKFKQRTSNKFCPVCGAEVKQYKDKPLEVITPDSYELGEVWKQAGLGFEDLWDATNVVEASDDFRDHQIYLGNLRGHSKLEYDDERHFTLLFREITPERELKKFEKFYEKHLKIMRELFEEVHVEFGVAAYSM